MIPLSDPGNRRSHFPIATVAIIAINVLVFLYQLTLSSNALDNFVLAYSVRPIEIVTGRDLPPASIQPIWLTIITSMFMHGGWAHILGNMLYLWVFGDNVEDVMGTPIFVLFYLAAGVAGSLAHVLSDPMSQFPSLGASGAIAGVLAAYMLMFPTARIKTLVWFFIFIRIIQLPAILLIGFWALLQFLNGFGSLGASGTDGVAYFAHIGGFVAGLVLALPFRQRAQHYRDLTAPRYFPSEEE